MKKSITHYYFDVYSDSEFRVLMYNGVCPSYKLRKYLKCWLNAGYVVEIYDVIESDKILDSFFPDSK